MRVLGLFDGKSCGQIALLELGIIPEVYYASEIDRPAIKQTQLNFPDTIQLGDVWRLRCAITFNDKTVCRVMSSQYISDKNKKRFAFARSINWSLINLILAGSPCQGFSFAGKQLAFNDPRSKLFFEFIKILNYIKKLNPNVLFLLENVNMKKTYLRVISEYCELFPVRINSARVSAQNRDRWYWSNIRTRQEGLFGEIHTDIPQPEDRGIFIKDILEDDVDEKYYLSDKCVQKLLAHAERQKENGTGFAKKFHKMNEKMSALKVGGQGADDLIEERCAGVAVTERGLRPYKNDGHQGTMSEFGTISFINQKADALTTQHEPKIIVHNMMPRSGKTGRGGTGHLARTDGKTYCLDTGQTNAVQIGMRVRRLTPTELSRCQTIPKWYKWKCSDTQVRKMCGNGWTIEVIKHILSFLPDIDKYKNLNL